MALPTPLTKSTIPAPSTTTAESKTAVATPSADTPLTPAQVPAPSE